MTEKLVARLTESLMAHATELLGLVDADVLIVVESPAGKRFWKGNGKLRRQFIAEENIGRRGTKEINGDADFVVIEDDDDDDGYNRDTARRSQSSPRPRANASDRGAASSEDVYSYRRLGTEGSNETSRSPVNVNGVIGNRKSGFEGSAGFESRSNAISTSSGLDALANIPRQIGVAPGMTRAELFGRSEANEDVSFSEPAPKRARPKSPADPNFFANAAANSEEGAFESRRLDAIRRTIAAYDGRRDDPPPLAASQFQQPPGRVTNPSLQQLQFGTNVPDIGLRPRLPEVSSAPPVPAVSGTSFDTRFMNNTGMGLGVNVQQALGRSEPQPPSSASSQDPRFGLGSRDLRLSIASQDPRMSIGAQDPRMSIGAQDPRMSIVSQQQHLSVGSQDQRMFVGTQGQRLSIGSQDQRLSIGSQDQRLSIGSQDQRLSIGAQDQRLSIGSQDHRLPVSAPFSLPFNVPAAAPMVPNPNPQAFVGASYAPNALGATLASTSSSEAEKQLLQQELDKLKAQGKCRYSWLQKDKVFLVVRRSEGPGGNKDELNKISTLNELKQLFG